jgi:hypothetical protein
MAETLPVYLQQLEPLTGALDIIRYLNRSGVSDGITVADDLDLSERSFDKAKRRLVTNGYIAARSDGVMELTQKGINAARELAEYDASGPSNSRGVAKVQRKVLVALPRTLAPNAPAPLYLGIDADTSGRMQHETDLVFRLSALNATLDVKGDQIVRVGSGAARHTVKLTAAEYDQVRVRVEVFQLSADGEDIQSCGGMYVDVDVQPGAPANSYIAYGAVLEFDAS